MDFSGFLMRAFGPTLEQAVNRAEMRRDGPFLPGRGRDNPPTSIGDIFGEKELLRDLNAAANITRAGSPDLAQMYEAVRPPAIRTMGH